MGAQYQREWDGDDWESFARSLVQLRHGPENVQNVPSKVKGDAGIEFFTTDGCCYQCYATEETVDTAKAASAMKQKATRDLPKLIKNREVILGVLGDIKLRRWILLCPFLDDKAVITHVRAKAKEVVEAQLSFVEDKFHGMVHSQVDFEKEIETLRQSSRGIPLRTVVPTDEDIKRETNLIDNRLDGKLRRGFPQDSVERGLKRKTDFIRAHLRGANSLHSLKQDFPDLWERLRRTVEAEETRLETIGAGSGAPAEQLQRSLDRLEDSISRELPSLDRSTITSIANGTLGAWLIECPLDFTDEAS